MRSQAKQKILSQLCTLARQRLPAQSIEQFLQLYYQHVATEDLENKVLDDLYGAALSHWHFANSPQHSKQPIHIYNPNLEQHGWESAHTIVEVVVEDMPFLVQSLTLSLNRHGLTNHLVIHPVLHVKRSHTGQLLKLSVPADRDAIAESYIHIEIDRQSTPELLLTLTQSLNRTLSHTRAATQDWKACQQQIQYTCKRLSEEYPSSASPQDQQDAIAFLQWLLKDHFIFLGYREYEITHHKKSKGYSPIIDTGLGVLRDSLNEACDFQPIHADAATLINTANPLLLSKSTDYSTVYRPVLMDSIGVKRYNKTGQVIGEQRFWGLYTSSAYHCELKQIPLIQRKVEHLLEQSSFTANSHSARSLLHVLESLPRDELFQADESYLFETAIGVLHLQERQRVRVFVRQDLLGHFVSLIVFVPRDRYHTQARQKIQAILDETFKGKRSSFQVQISESIWARVHFIIHSCETCLIDYDVKGIEQAIVTALYEWRDQFKDTLLSHLGEEHGNQLYHQFGEGFSAAYREDFNARNAIVDLEHIEQLQSDTSSIQMILYQPIECQHNHNLKFKLFCQQQPAPLSSTLPMLENMGVQVIDERPYEIIRQDIKKSYWLHDFGLNYSDADSLDIETSNQPFQSTFEQVWLHRVDNDGFNRLVLKANLNWRQIVIVRAYYFYLRQIGLTFSQTYVEQTLVNHAAIVRLLVQLFETRFNPLETDPDSHAISITTRIQQQIDEVSSLDEDKILRHYLELIQATVRSNYYQQQTDNLGIPYLSIKLRPGHIQKLPEPRPFAEIFVYSPRMEGVHLRGGPVARGGIRWSDRREDFRTEILGLMKAQMTKNAVIVPTGAKGGFVAKRLSDSFPKEKAQDEVSQCYQILIRGLLDLTDNRIGTTIIKPDQVVCYDDDDPYLVVAADKGTATFSDIANQLAQNYGYWLHDAFASGGSVGYDHKKMGITARGAWESVKHHFYRLGINCQTTPFSVIGIGDMSGDVFGNGMLLSQQIRLLAAFNHQHIFLDPDPDPSISFEERKRLFELPRSSWHDYNSTLISAGGGVYSRKIKSIPISSQVRVLLAIDNEHLAPNELIRALLRAPIELLWNGGIGTYIKATGETQSDAGDKSNDGVRVNASELNCKIIAEGGNLGLTQRGRIEFAEHGGSINTDSIDNSAGVDCSDHEVNIKIPLNSVISDGDLTQKQRNQLLSAMTDEVAELVLRHNYLQVRSISMIEAESVDLLPLYERMIELLESQGQLDRRLECIPTATELTHRKIARQGLYRPEIAVLLAYTKIMLKQQLLSNGNAVDAQIQAQELLHYFPSELQKRCPQSLNQHRLGREIIANRIINDLVNRLGIVTIFRVMDETSATITDIVSSYRLACDIFATHTLWQAIESLETTVNAKTLHEMTRMVGKLVERALFWWQYNLPKNKNIVELGNQYRTAIETLSPQLLKLLTGDERRRVRKTSERFQRAGVPKPIATQIACLDGSIALLDVIAIQQKINQPLDPVARVYFKLDEQLQWSWLATQISLLPREDLWQSLARSAIRNNFSVQCRNMAEETLLASKQIPSVNQLIRNWSQHNDLSLQRYRSLREKSQLDSSITIEKVEALLKEMQAIVPPQSDL